MKAAIFSFPKPYDRMWEQLVKVAQKVLVLSLQPNDDLWVILALAKKAAKSVNSCASLISLEHWGDTFTIGRSMLELDIIIKWLCEQDTQERLSEYLSGIQDEKKRFLKKMNDGYSTFAQIYSEFYGKELRESISEGEKSWNKHNLRELSVEIGEEHNYDSFYWVSSAFVHSHVLSLFEWNADLRQNEIILAPIFSPDKQGTFQFSILVGVLVTALSTFETANNKLNLGMTDEIELTWKLLQTDILNSTGVYLSRKHHKPEFIVKGTQESGEPYEKHFIAKKRPRHKKDKT